MRRENIITKNSFDFAVSFSLTQYIINNQHVNSFRHCEFYFFQ